MDVAQLAISVNSTDVKNASSAMDKAADSASNLEGMVKKMTAAFGVYKIAEFVKDMTLLSARYETLGVVMGQMGLNAGYASSEMARFQMQLENTGISMTAARQALNMMSAAQLDLSKSAALARVAQDAAVIAGTNSSEAFESLVRSIQTGQAIIAHHAGMMVNYEEAERRAAAAIGKTKDQLTERQKAEARFNEMLDEGAKRQGAYAAAMDTAGKQMLSMERYVENLKVQMGGIFQPALSESVLTLTGSLKGMSEWIQSNGADMENLAQAMKSTLVAGESLLGALSQIAGGSDTASGALSGLANTIRGIGLGLAATADVIRKDGALIRGFLDSITEGGDAAHAKWQKSVTAQSSVDKFLEAVEKGQGKVESAAFKTEQLAYAQEQVNKYTAEYTRLETAMASAGPKGMTKENKALLEQVGLWRDIFEFKEASLKNNIGEQWGPVAPMVVKATVDNSAAKAAEEYRESVGKLNIELAQERINLEQGALAAYDFGLKMKGLDEADRLALDWKKGFNELLKGTISLEKQLLEGRKQLKEVNPDIAKGLFGSYKEAMDLGDPTRQARADIEAQKASLEKWRNVMPIENYKRALQGLAMAELKLKAENGDLWASMGMSVISYADRSTEALANFFNGTKTGFRDMVASMLLDIEKLIIKQQIVMPLMGNFATWMNGFSYNNGGGGGAGMGQMGGGDYVPYPTGGLMANPGPALSMKGNPSVSNNIQVFVGSDGKTETKGVGSLSPKEMKAIGDLMGAKCREVLVDESRCGGMLNPGGRRN